LGRLFPGRVIKEQTMKGEVRKIEWDYKVAKARR